eukprot:scaffold98373_cov75-Phaeocystis_antarctica.AAC.6
MSRNAASPNFVPVAEPKLSRSASSGCISSAIGGSMCNASGASGWWLQRCGSAKSLVARLITSHWSRSAWRRGGRDCRGTSASTNGWSSETIEAFREVRPG